MGGIEGDVAACYSGFFGLLLSEKSEFPFDERNRGLPRNGRMCFCFFCRVFWEMILAARCKAWIDSGDEFSARRLAEVR